VQRTALPSGLETNVVELPQLPLVYLRLVIRSGGEADPRDLPGLSKLVAAMLQEGTRRRSSAELAEAIEFLGADLSTNADEESVELVFRALSEHLDPAMDLLAEVALQPAFRDDELRKLKRRELDRLSLMDKDPSYVARRAFYANLYGDHPYARVDTTPAAVERVRKSDLQRWHRTHFVPSNAFLVVAGSVAKDRVDAAVARAFGRWRGRSVAAPTYTTPPERARREVVIVDRPGSVQSVIRIGNLALRRNDDAYVPLSVANQVLGGSAASRLFMDLRERRSLTYGAYSDIGERVEIGPFLAQASVRNAVTLEAVSAFFEHLDRIVREEAPEAELADARRYLSDSFPLRIDTTGKIAGLVSELRVFGLPDDYWEGFRRAIAAVTPAEALAAARVHIRPERALIVVVGQAADFADGLRAYGPVTVIGPGGNVSQRLEATGASAESEQTAEEEN
jgi:zinc protease